MGAESVVSGTSYTGSARSASSSVVKRTRVDKEHTDENGEDIWNRRSTLEQGVFGVLFTLSKEKSETRIRIRWVLLKVLLDSWQLLTTVINPIKQGWSINDRGTVWTVVSVLNFTWLDRLGYKAYLGVLYGMVALLAINVAMCVWVAWCFKEHKFPVVWPIKVLRVFSSVFFQAFDVASLNLLQLGISCRYNGPAKPHLHLDLFPEYSCTEQPQIVHAIVSGVCLVLFVLIALLLNMAEVEVNPLSRRPNALGHSGAEVAAFGIKVLLTLVDVFLGWPRAAACFYFAFSLALAWQYLRWSPHLVNWMNYLKSGVSVSICWCTAILMLLVFKPGVKAAEEDKWADTMTILMLAGLAPAFCAGALMSWAMIRYLTGLSLQALANPKGLQMSDAFNCLDEPRDIELGARCCRSNIAPYTLGPETVDTAHRLIKAGLEVFPKSPFMVVMHADFMIDVLGVSQSGGRRMEDARKLNPGLMCRFIMFIRQQQATQSEAGSSVNSSSTMDLLGYVEYQRKQRMVVRLHREALQAMCNFWKALDSNRVSFTALSKALSKIETSVSQAQTAYRVVLERYGNNPKLVRLYGKFLQTIKNDPWHAAEYFAEAERLEELQDGQAGGPLMPDGTPLARMDDVDSAVVLVDSTGTIQIANKHTHSLFGWKRGSLEGKPLSTLLAPQFSRWLAKKVAGLVDVKTATAEAAGRQQSGIGHQEKQRAQVPAEEVVVGVHSERMAFPVKISLSLASGVGEDSTLIAMIDPAPVTKGEASLWVAANGIITACDPRFISMFGWKASEANGTYVNVLVSMPAVSATGALPTRLPSVSRVEPSSSALSRLLLHANSSTSGSQLGGPTVLPCFVQHKFSPMPLASDIRLVENDMTTDTGIIMYQLIIRLSSPPLQLLVVNRKGHVMHSSPDVATWLKDSVGPPGARAPGAGGGGPMGLLGAARVAGREALSAGQDAAAGPAGGGGVTMTPSIAEALSGYTLFDFLPPPWRDMHPKLLKEITPITPSSLGTWNCRKVNPDGNSGPTLTLRSATGKELLMHVTAQTANLSGETVHVIHMSRSSLQEGLAERRLRLRLSPDGRIAEVVQGKVKQLFGLDPSEILDLGLWEILDETPNHAHEILPHGPDVISALVERELGSPGCSWRVQVAQPARKVLDLAGTAERRALSKSLSKLQRSVLTTSCAVMQIYLDGDPDSNEVDMTMDSDAPTIWVDLWPVASVTGVLQLDSHGRITSVLEEHLRPAGLLFGLPTKTLLGSKLGEHVTLPPGRQKPVDLLTSGAKKSSLKTNRKDSTAKMGPVHILQASHVDGLSLSLDVQVLGKPYPEDSYTAILRFHSTPVAGTAVTASVPGQGGKGTCGMALQMARASSSPPKEAASPAAAAAAASVFASPLTPSQPRLSGSNGAFAVTSKDPLMPSPFARQADSLKPSTPPDPVGTPPGKIRSSSALMPDEGPMDTILEEDSGPNTAPGAPSAESAIPATTAAPKPLPSPSRAFRGAVSRSSVYPSPLKPTAGLSHASSLPPPSAMSNSSARAPELAAARSKLSVLVKTVGGVKRSTASSRGEPGEPQVESVRPSPSRRPGSWAGGRQPAERSASAGPSLPASVEPPVVAHITPVEGAKSVRSLMKGDMERPPASMAPRDDSDGSAHSSDLENNEASKSRPSSAADRVREWVVSKGAFYQNSVVSEPLKVAADDTNGRDGEASSDAGVAVIDRSTLRKHSTARPSGGSSKPAAGGATAPEGEGRVPPPPVPPTLSPHGPGPDDDAASDGGQSAVSAAPSASGSEYTRGKRYKKLTKLMDSPQAQQAERRLRIQTFVAIAVLAAVHTVCFAMTVTSIQSERENMLSLGRSGEALVDMHRIMTDTRSLDIITSNKSLPNLFTFDDHDFFIARLAKSADDIKVRFNEILNANARKGEDSGVMQVLYHTHRAVWDGKDVNGSDRYVNVTIWDFATRFYTNAKYIEQNHDEYLAAHQRVAETEPGQFLLKSGPDLWTDMRKVLDALLFNAVDNAEWIDRLQVAFLVVEGAGISFIAACYLAYLLRTVAIQRYKLYGTFLVIPLGLTRALASQNTNILLDEDEDDNEDDEDDREADRAALEADDGESAGAMTVSKVKRRATLNVSSDKPRNTTTSASNYRERRGSGLGGYASDANLPGGEDVTRRRGSGVGVGYDKRRSPMGEMLGEASCWSWSWWRSRVQGAFRRTRGAVLPSAQPSLSQPSFSNGFGALGSVAALGKKRSLKGDSRETYIMLLPFVVWSLLVIVVYTFAVIKMTGVVEVVAVHSVVNFMSGRAYRTVFFCQELANVDDPTELDSHRKALLDVIKYTRDAWYTLQLGETAWQASGNDTERFSLVKTGVAHRSPQMEKLFYTSGLCHRQPENMPCVGPDHRFYAISHTGVDSMMQQLMTSLMAMATNSSMVPEGLEDEHFDFVYNVGGKDLLDGTIEIAKVHYGTILKMFNDILVLHIILFLLFWVIFTCFVVFLLNPLLGRVTRERRRIAELMSQLPLELDVEKLVGRALGTAATGPAGAAGGGGTAPGGGGGLQDRMLSVDEGASNPGYKGGVGNDDDDQPDATTKWKLILRAASSLGNKQPNGSITMQRKGSGLIA